MPYGDVVSEQEAAGAQEGAVNRGGDLNPRQERNLARFNQYIAPNIPDPYEQTMTDRQKARVGRRALRPKAFGARVARFNMLSQLNPTYSATREEQRASYGDQLANGQDQVDLRQGEAPTLAATSKYVRERLGTGLTAEERAAFLAPQIESVEAGANEAQRVMGNRFAASGMDPRAALAAMGAIQNQRMQGRTAAARETELANLKRKGEIEGLATTVGGQEEQARHFNVAANQDRLARLENYMNSLGAQDEDRRQYDYGFLESRRQARLNRALLRQMQKAAEPSGLEQATAIIGGINSGLSMGGGGGGGGGGGMMGG